MSCWTNYIYVCLSRKRKMLQSIDHWPLQYLWYISALHNTFKDHILIFSAKKYAWFMTHCPGRRCRASVSWRHAKFVKNASSSSTKIPMPSEVRKGQTVIGYKRSRSLSTACTSALYLTLTTCSQWVPTEKVQQSLRNKNCGSRI